MKLFRYEGYKVVISEEAFALKVFRQIWNRDRSVNKDKAIIEGEGLPSNWKPDKVVTEAITFYKSLKSTSALLLEDTRAVIDNVRKTLRKFSFDDMEDKDRVNAIKSVASTIATIPKLIKDLDEAEKAVTSEMQNTSGKVRGQKEKSIFEDGIL